MLATGIPDGIRPSPIVTLAFYAKSDLLRAAERQEAIPIETSLERHRLTCNIGVYD